MEHFYFIDVSRKVIYQTFRGDITTATALDSLEKLAQDPDYNEKYAVLTDLRKSTFKSNRQAFNTFYLKVMEIFPATGRKSAFVVNDPMISAFALLFAKHSDNTRQVRVFAEPESACDWLSGELGYRIFPDQLGHSNRIA